MLARENFDAGHRGEITPAEKPNHQLREASCLSCAQLCLACGRQDCPGRSTHIDFVEDSELKPDFLAGTLFPCSSAEAV